MTKLTETMRQKNDQPIWVTELLNRFRAGAQIDEDICYIQWKSKSLLDSNYPSVVLHIWAENIPVDKHNNTKLAVILKPMFTLPQINILTMSINKILTEYWQEQIWNWGLDYELHLNEKARVMLTANIDISDRLINGQIDKAVQLDVNPNT